MRKPRQDSVSDDALRQFVGYHIRRASSVVQSDLASTLKPFELRMLTYSALVLIAKNSGLSQSQLAVAMGIERPNLVMIIDELEQRELVVRERDPSDRRVYALRPTLAGQELCDEAMAANAALEARVLADLDAAARDALIAALSALHSPKPT